MDPLGPVDHVCSRPFHGCLIGLGSGGVQRPGQCLGVPPTIPKQFLECDGAHYPPVSGFNVVADRCVLCNTKPSFSLR